MGVEFSGLETPATELTLQTSIYFDGLTKDTFIQRVLLTLRALGIAVRTYLRALEAQSGPDSHGRSPEQRVFTREELREIVQVLPRADAPVTIAG